MGSLTGTRRLTVLVARLERVRLSVWIVALGLMPLLVASSFASLYPSDAERAALARTLASAPALVALLGPINGTSVGALTAWRIGTIGATLIAFMAAFAVIRHTRADEEEGRSELLGSTVVGRHAPLAAAVIGAMVAGAGIGVTTTVGLIVVGEAVSGALAFGAGWFLIAVAFAGVGAVAAQMTSSASGARAIAGSTIGTFFVVRLAGDGAADNGFGWLSWLSPIGWSSKLEAFGTERWWVTVLLLAFAVAVLSVAVILASRRDVGGGVAEPRPGPAEASAGLRSVFGLARRLQTTSLLGWIAAIVGAAAVWGVLAETVNDMLEDNPQLAEIFEALGGIGRLTDVFFGALFGIVAIIVSAYAISVVLTLQHEEHTHRAEALLATPTPRLRWAASHLVYAVAGPVILLVVAAVVSGSVYGSTVGDVAGNAFVAMDSALVQLPAVWLTTALVVALYGFAPRQAGLAWGVLVIFLLLGQLGSILQLPQWALDLSPFTHVPAPPGPIRALPLVVMSVFAVAVGALGLAGLRRRDIA